jgi:hypothetical protein
MWSSLALCVEQVQIIRERMEGVGEEASSLTFNMEEALTALSILDSVM